MSLARIRAENPANASFLADALRRSGFEVQVLRPAQPAAGEPEFELTLESHASAEIALEQATRLAERKSCDLLIAPGVLRYEPPRPEPVSVPQASVNSEDLEREEPTLEPAIETPVPGTAPEIQERAAQPSVPAAPSFNQRLLDAGAIMAAALQNRVERTPELVAQAWKRIAQGGSAVARVCVHGCAEVSRTARKHWQHARERYAAARAAAAARDAENRATRAQQAKFEHTRRSREEARILVEPVGVSHLPPTTSTRPAAWRTALAGAIVAALVIGIGFAVGARRTPAAVASPNLQQQVPFGATTVHASATAAPRTIEHHSVTAPPKKAVPRRRVVNSLGEDDDEVVVRHFAPAKSAAPQVTSDGIKHYSDDSSQ